MIEQESMKQDFHPSQIKGRHAASREAHDPQQFLRRGEASLLSVNHETGMKEGIFQDALDAVFRIGEGRVFFKNLGERTVPQELCDEGLYLPSEIAEPRLLLGRWGADLDIVLVWTEIAAEYQLGNGNFGVDGAAKLFVPGPFQGAAIIRRRRGQGNQGQGTEGLPNLEQTLPPSVPKMMAFVHD